jgi:hypothetical protein
VPGHVINFQGDVWQPTELPNYTLHSGVGNSISLPKRCH